MSAVREAKAEVVREVLRCWDGSTRDPLTRGTLAEIIVDQLAALDADLHVHDQRGNMGWADETDPD